MKSEYSMALCAVPARCSGVTAGIWLSAGVVFWCFICNRQRKRKCGSGSCSWLTALSRTGRCRKAVDFCRPDIPPLFTLLPKMRCRC